MRILTFIRTERTTRLHPWREFESIESARDEAGKCFGGWDTFTGESSIVDMKNEGWSKCRWGKDCTMFMVNFDFYMDRTKNILMPSTLDDALTYYIREKVLDDLLD